MEKLPASVVYITSIGPSKEEILNPSEITGGAVCDVSRKLAAQRIVDGTHSLSTPEEIARFHQEQRQRDQLCLAEREKQRATAIKVLPQELAEALGLGLADLK
jgi:hypothetical protein